MRFIKVIAILIFCFLYASCELQRNQKDIFYYDVYSSEKKVNAYYRIVSTIQNDSRIDTISRFNLDGEKVDEQIEEYVVTLDTLYKISFDNKRYPYLIVDKEKCNILKQKEEVKTCLINNNEKYLIFTERTLITDGIKKKLTFDKEFNLIENEYLDGFLSYYRISKRDDKPSVLVN